MKQFDDQLLEEFTLGFYGHGNLDGDYCFFGMEHGGGDSFENIKQRISMWAEQGKEPVTDLAEYCSGIGEAHYFRHPAKNQPTWNKLLLLLLSLRGEERITLAQVKAYQVQQLGRHDDETCLLELLSLANPSLSHSWLYGTPSGLPHLESRETYRAYLAPLRADKLKKMIKEYQPCLVHFYSGSYNEWWQQISDVPLEQHKADTRTFSYGCNGDTRYLITQHPVAQGITIKYFEEIGRFLRKRL